MDCMGVLRSHTENHLIFKRNVSIVTLETIYCMHSLLYCDLVEVKGQSEVQKSVPPSWNDDTLTTQWYIQVHSIYSPMIHVSLVLWLVIIRAESIVTALVADMMCGL